MKIGLFIFCIFLAMLTKGLFAQYGILDIDFSIDGKQTTDFNYDNDVANSVAIQPDGKIVVAGYSYSNKSNRDFALTRYNIDGTLDNTFGTDGKVTTDFNQDYDNIYSIAIQSDGKIVAAGVTATNSTDNFYFALARYNVDGTLDRTFGNNGKLSDGFPGNLNAAHSIAIQDDSKIILAGHFDQDFALIKYTKDGNKDNWYNSKNIIITDFNSGIDIAQSVAIQTDGKIVVAGYSNIDFALARYNTDGTLDSSFGIEGKITTNIDSSNNVGTSMIIQSDGKIILAGRSNADFAMVRYNIDGTLDNTFGIDGQVTTNFNNKYSVALSLALQSDGKIILAGFSYSESLIENFSLARYNTDGSLDKTFGIEGKLTTEFGSRGSIATSACIQSDDKILLVGYSESDSTEYDFALARYITDLNLGIIDFHKSNNSMIIYPNPITKDAILEYILTNQEIVSINLTDIQGKVIKSFITNNIQGAGKYKHTIELPEEIPSGYYFIILSTKNSFIKIKIIIM